MTTITIVIIRLKLPASYFSSARISQAPFRPSLRDRSDYLEAEAMLLSYAYVLSDSNFLSDSDPKSRDLLGDFSASLETTDEI